MFKKYTLFFLFFSFSWLGMFPLMAQNSDDLEQLIRESKTRAALVENVKKAVVHIKVEKMVRAHDGSSLNNPRDLYNDEFFKRFFPELLPPKQPNSPQNQPRREFKQEGMGSGSIIDSKGYILTNHHVVGEADKIIVVLHDGTEKEAKLVGTDPESDIAVVQIEGENLPVLPTGNSDHILVGEDVIAVGNPFGLIQTVTYGIVSAKGRSNVGINEYENFIQTDAAINPGNSGGPLVNLRGEIVAVNTAIFSRSGGYQGIGFAVPINMAKRIMTDLIKDGAVSRGWLGVGIQDVTQELAQAFQLENTKGSLISGVMRDTPAEKAGLQKGDVVVQLNGKEVRDSNHFRNEIANAGAFTVIELGLIRNGEKLNIKLKLDKRPKQIGQQMRHIPQQMQNEVLGMVLQELSSENAKEFGLSDREGILIREVLPESPAEKAGLRAGMLIQEVERKPISNMKQFMDVLKSADPEKGLLLLVTTLDGSRYIFLQNK